MNNKNLILRNLFLLVILLFINTSVSAQLRFYAETSAGYIEHMGTGFGLCVNNKHELGFVFGSNCFVNTHEFNNILLKYQSNLMQFKFNELIPSLGIKGGTSVYTNEYYKWKLLVLVPHLGLNYPLTKHLQLFTNIGVAFSRELAMTRVSFGEIGFYKRFLPEFNLGIKYKL